MCPFLTLGTNFSVGLRVPGAATAANRPALAVLSCGGGSSLGGGRWQHGEKRITTWCEGACDFDGGESSGGAKGKPVCICLVLGNRDFAGFGIIGMVATMAGRTQEWSQRSRLLGVD